MSIISLRDICFAYETDIALRHVNLEIYKGSLSVLLGPNGCGKSTLLRLLNGLIFPNSGTYYFDGTEINKKFLSKPVHQKWLHSRIGYVFQNVTVQLFCSTVYDEIAFGPQQLNLNKDEVAERVEDCLTILGIQNLARKAPYNLSGGEQKKVAIASVLAMNPDLYCLDEPFSGLDNKSRDWLIGFLKELKDCGKTIIISTHEQQYLAELEDCVYIFNEEHSLGSTEKDNS